MTPARISPARALVVFVLLAVAACPAAAAEGARAKRVLLVYSHERELAMYSGFDRAFRARLQAGASWPVEFYTEYLDLIRFAEPIHKQSSIDYFRTKYAEHGIDLVVPIGSLAFDFVVEHGPAMLPDVPILFTSVNASRIAQTTLDGRTTGVAVRRDVRQTIDLILALQPETQMIVIPIGSSPTEKAWAQDTRELFRPYEARVRITYLSDLSMDAILREVSALPEHSAVLFTTVFYYDAAGRYFMPDEALASITARSTAPVFGTDEAFLGSGIVGGILYDPSKTGEPAGRLAQRALAGDRPADIPVETIDPNAPMFDARQLERWHIPAKRLPGGSVIRFAETGTWQRYKFYIVGASSLMILQAALIVGLIAARARRRRAEASLGASHVQIRQLAGRLIHAQEQERTRLARELHDDVGQRMAVVGIDLMKLQRMLPPGAVEARTIVVGLDSAVTMLARDVQAISHSLHSSKLEYLGLAVAAGSFCAEISSRHDVNVEFVPDNVPSDLDKDAAISLFRVLQEAVSNVLKHSGARHCRVTLRGLRDEVTLQVVDDGAGFDAAAALLGHGLGLVSMRERLRLVNGDVTVDSTAGQGTTIRATVPWPAKLSESARAETETAATSRLVNS